MTMPAAPNLLITGRTKVMFLIADPVDHVIGTAVLNAAWAAEGRDIVAVPLHVRPADLADALAMIRRAPNVAGTGITIPHKIAAAGLVDRLTEAAAQAGAVNFIRRDADGRLTGHNVDGAGFLAGLGAAGVEVAGRSVALAGAGGVARAIGFALAGAGAGALNIRNRDAAKAERLIADIAAWPGAARCRLSANAPVGAADILINATALGMRAEDPTPFAAAELPDAATVAEVVMAPALTPLLKAAAARGLRTVPGRAMMDPQAALVARFLDGDPA